MICSYIPCADIPILCHVSVELLKDPQIWRTQVLILMASCVYATISYDASFPSGRSCGPPPPLGFSSELCVRPLGTSSGVSYLYVESKSDLTVGLTSLWWAGGWAACPGTFFEFDSQRFHDNISSHLVPDVLTYYRQWRHKQLGARTSASMPLGSDSQLCTAYTIRSCQYSVECFTYSVPTDAQPRRG